MKTPPRILQRDGMYWQADEPPFRAEPVELPKPGLDVRFWQGVGGVLAFYAIGAAILIELFRPSWLHAVLHVMGVQP